MSNGALTFSHAEDNPLAGRVWSLATQTIVDIIDLAVEKHSVRKVSIFFNPLGLEYDFRNNKFVIDITEERIMIFQNQRYSNYVQ